MNSDPKITYLLGAGASWYACPVLNEQGVKMIELARIHFNEPSKLFIKKTNPRNFGTTNADVIMWDIGFFGTVSLKYGTIDTYAKKLELNQSTDELERLKLAVSIFFTIWQLTDDEDLKKRGDVPLDEIDRRYISLMASIIERINGTNKIKENVRFVTWNYDLQLEYAYKSFCNDNMIWDHIADDLKFRVIEGEDSKLEICHLNGYHGFYKTRSGEHHILDRTESKNIEDIISGISFLRESQNQGSIDITDHINYAWEDNPLSKKAREEAQRIFSETEILIIIGYSFPNFNKEIDKALFRELEGRPTKIFYQDPNASLTFLHQLVDPALCEISCQNEKLDNFIIPY